MNVMSKKIYFETTETTIKNRKGCIEIDADFTQVYDCFSEICVLFKSHITSKLLFWLLSHEANKSNGIRSGKPIYESFLKFMTDRKQTEITERTFQRCFEELTEVGVLTRVGRGLYYFSPYMFWRDEKSERIKFITDEAKEKRYISHNPTQKT